MRFPAITAGLIVLLASPSYAAKWDSGINLSVREVYTDNINLSAENSKESDFVTDITPSMVVTGKGRRLSLNFAYSIQNTIHAEDSDRNNTNHRLNTRLNSELIDKFLFFEASARISQQLENTRQGVSDDRISGARNVNDVYGYTLSPSIKPRLGDVLEADVRYTYDYVESDAASGGFSDSEGNSLQATVVNGAATANLYWNLSFSSRETEYDDGDTTETESAQGRIGYRLGNKWSIYVSGNHEDNEFTGDRGNTDPEDSSYGGGLSWQPNANFRISAGYNERGDPRPDEDESFSSGDIYWSPSQRTQLSASWGQRFFGETYDLRFSHRMRRSSWQIAYNEGVSDFRQQFLSQQLVGALICPIGTTDFQQCRIFDQNNPPQIGEEVIGIVGLVPSVNNNTFITKSTNASWSIIGGKNVVTLGVNDQRREFVSDNQEEVDLSVNLSWSYKVGPRTTTGLSARHTTREFDAGDESTEVNVRWTLQKRIGAKTNVSLEASHTDREADLSQNESIENRAVISIRHSF